jgi:uncharacterized protein YjbI with pentapeptide repeats
MLTRHKFTPPIPTGDSATDFRNLCRSISDFFGALEQKNALQIDSAQIRAASGIVFPASQGAASSDANTLDDYAEGTWTPADASGASLSISAGYAKYTKVGRVVLLTAQLTWPATANASVAKLSGAPFTAADVYVGAANGQTGNAAAALIQGTNVTFNTVGSVQLTNANLSGSIIRFAIAYHV